MCVLVRSSCLECCIQSTELNQSSMQYWHRFTYHITTNIVKHKQTAITQFHWKSLPCAISMRKKQRIWCTPTTIQQLNSLLIAPLLSKYRITVCMWTRMNRLTKMVQIYTTLYHRLFALLLTLLLHAHPINSLTVAQPNCALTCQVLWKQAWISTMISVIPPSHHQNEWKWECWVLRFSFETC